MSRHSPQIQQLLLTDLGTGITVHTAVRGYGSTGVHEDSQMIQIILNRIDSKKAYRVIESIDKDAFILEFEVNQIRGGVLRRYIAKSKNKNLPPTLHEHAGG